MPLLNPTSTGSGFNLGGVIGQLGDFFGGFFAEGGSFSSGKPIVVGEQGPEIIMPRRGGTVIPNDQIGGGRSTVVNVHISTPDAQSFKRSQSQIAAQMAQAVSQGNRNL